MTELNRLRAAVRMHVKWTDKAKDAYHDKLEELKHELCTLKELTDAEYHLDYTSYQLERAKDALYRKEQKLPDFIDLLNPHLIHD